MYCRCLHVRLYTYVLPLPSTDCARTLVVKVVLLASPGFVREQFAEFLFLRAVKQDLKVLLENRGKFLQVHSSSGHKHSLTEVLTDPAVTARLSDTKAAAEIKALGDFYKMLQHEPDRAFYG
ncbi:protein pelota homolog [Bombina bombina]|uniref:protein pelota homolog n=1 Tax=Bombina bombina TaxID=8345 RepID=UPI00235AB458|nr:protein pelota homolog [Bombina bombina]